jgi:hypothetical protein
VSVEFTVVIKFIFIIILMTEFKAYDNAYAWINKNGVIINDPYTLKGLKRFYVEPSHKKGDLIPYRGERISYKL